MFIPVQDHNYCKDDQDDPPFKTAEEQNVSIQSLLPAIHELDRYGPQAEDYDAIIEAGCHAPKLPVCNNETLIEYSRSLVAEKYREQNSFAPRPWTTLVDEGYGYDPFVIASPPSSRPTVHGHNSSAVSHHSPIALQHSQLPSLMSNDAPPSLNQTAFPLRRPSASELSHHDPTIVPRSPSLRPSLSEHISHPVVEPYKQQIAQGSGNSLSVVSNAAPPTPNVLEDPLTYLESRVSTAKERSSPVGKPGPNSMTQNTSSQYRSYIARRPPIFFDTASDPEFGFLSPEYLIDFQAPSVPGAPFTSFNQMAKHFGDDELAESILNQKETNFARSYEDKIKGFRRTHWNKIKVPIIEDIVLLKFWCSSPPTSPEENILPKLLSTGDAHLFYAVEDRALLGASGSVQDIILQDPTWSSMPRMNALRKTLMVVRKKANDWLGPEVSKKASSLLCDPREDALLCALKRGHLIWDLATGKLMVGDGHEQGSCGELLR
ncbi:hypothetical protein DL98DRAFT_567721 [Cadophora sp. DSE1049]|nr:hypothetical protein DL98DRAFT_567721 [Cadophora sp. DSE1049]